MSTKNKLLAMTEDLKLPGETQAAAQGGLVPEAVPHPTPEPSAAVSAPAPKFPPVGLGAGLSAKTGPGQMLQFRGQMLAAEGELGKLREQLKQHENAVPTRKLDPQLVIPSRWANRHAAAFGTPEFARLKQDIEQAGGNVQPISVRPSPDQPGRFEIVFGHRRHRACTDLGLPVLATIETAVVSDHDLFSAMDRENRERADLSPYEQGAMYRRALDEKLYPSNRRLAEALGVSHTWVANVLLVADLPAPVVACFRSPLEIQHRHAKAITHALDVDRKGVLRRAEKLRQQERPLGAAAVVAGLVGSGREEDQSQGQAIYVGSKSVGQWSTDRAGRLVVQIEAEHLTEDRQRAVIDAVAKALWP